MTFPAAPTVGQTHSLGHRTWEWTGIAWKIARPVLSHLTTNTGLATTNLAATFAGVVPKQVEIHGLHTAPPLGFVHDRTGTVSDPFIYHGDGILEHNVGHEPVLTVKAQHVHIRGLTLRNPSSSVESRTGPGGSSSSRGTGLLLSRDNVSARHLTILDTGVGITTSTHIVNGSIYGCVILDNGWYGNDRGHGHGFYVQHNPVGTMTIKHNVVGFCAADGVKTAGDNGDASNFDVVGNTIVYPSERDTANGALTAFNHYSRDNSSQGMRWDGNWSIVSGGRSGYWLGWQEKVPIDQDMVITGAWHHGGTGIQLNYPWSSVTVTDSTFHSGPTHYLYEERAAGVQSRTISNVRFSGGRSKPFRLAGGPDLSFPEFVAATGATGCVWEPTEPPARAEVLPDDYDTKRAIVRIWNPSEADTVTVTGNNGPWVLRDALNPDASPCATGTGPTVDVPMTGHLLRTPAGLDRLPHPAPRFGVFLLTRR